MSRGMWGYVEPLVVFSADDFALFVLKNTQWVQQNKFKESYTILVDYLKMVSK